LGQRHPVLVTVLLVFGVGLLSGAFVGRAGNVLLSAFIGGVIGTVLFLLLASAPALIITVVSIRRACPDSFARRFMRNLEGTIELLIQGWS
jgi:hypothetical protein